jgi:hypothetical protein
VKLIRRLVHRYRHAGPDPLAEQILASMRWTPKPARRPAVNPTRSSQSVAGQLDRWRGERGHPQPNDA